MDYTAVSINVLPSNDTSTFPSVTDEERSRYIAQLHEAQLSVWWPTVGFLIIVGIVGLFGNSLVLRVFYKKNHRDATDVLIMAIATCDLVINVVAIPVTLDNILSVPKSDFKLKCQFKMYLSGATTMSSVLFLLAVTICRYRKICKPFGKPISIRTALKSTIAIPLISAALLTPVFPIFENIQIRPTDIPGIYTQHCTVDQDYVKKAKWPYGYASVMLFLFFGILLPLIVLNVLISIQAWRHSEIHGIPKKYRSKTTPITPKATSTESKDPGTTTNNSTNNTLMLSEGQRSGQPQRRVLTRTTLMMIAISAVYVISILPMIVIALCDATIPRFYDDMPAEERRAYQLFIRFYFINSGTNAIIYSLCDTRFRGVVKIFSCRKCKTSGRHADEGVSSKSGNTIDTSISITAV